MMMQQRFDQSQAPKQPQPQQMQQQQQQMQQQQMQMQLQQQQQHQQQMQMQQQQMQMQQQQMQRVAMHAIHTSGTNYSSQHHQQAVLQQQGATSSQVQQQQQQQHVSGFGGAGIGGAPLTWIQLQVPSDVEYFWQKLASMQVFVPKIDLFIRYRQQKGQANQTINLQKIRTLLTTMYVYCASLTHSPLLLL